MVKQSGFLALAALVLVGHLAGAATVCTSQPNKYGGTSSVTISNNDEDQPTLTFFFQGGKSKMAEVQGPFVAVKTQHTEGEVYLFVDHEGQRRNVTTTTSSFQGRRVTTASTDFYIGEGLSLTCK